MAKSGHIYAKTRNIANNGLLISYRTGLMGVNAALKVSKKFGQIAASAGKSVSKGSRKIASTATKKGKIDKRVLDSITIKSMNDDIEGWILSEYKGRKGKVIQQSSKNLYKQWLRWLNEYILLNVFGHLIVLDKAKRIIENESSYNEDERKLNVLALLFVEIQALRKWIESTNATLPMYLNQEDDNWLSKTIFPITSKPKKNSQLLGRSLAHLNNVCATVLRNINDIERSASVIGDAIEVQNTETKKHISDIFTDPKNLNPWFLLNNSENIVANVIPGLFTGKAKKRALNEYMKCTQKYDFLHSIIPALVVETQRYNLSNISSIIDRDFNFIGKQNSENSEIKKALFKRILKLEAHKRFTKIEKKNTLWMSYGEVIKEIDSLSIDCINKNNSL